jgi:hypothetical protein
MPSEPVLSSGQIVERQTPACIKHVGHVVQRRTALTGRKKNPPAKQAG